ALSALPMGGGTVESVRTALVGRIGENMSVRRFARVAAQGKLASYVHGGARIGVLVDVDGGDEALAKDLAMHIAASKPKALSKEGVPAQDVERERSIAAQKAAESGKPAEIVAKMVEGTVQKYLKEVTLLGQPFVKDDKLTVEQLLKQRGARVARFELYVVGEGIEKKQTDFAAEGAAQAAAAAGRWLRTAGKSPIIPGGAARTHSRVDAPIRRVREFERQPGAREQRAADPRAGLPARIAEALGRSADGRRGLRDRPGNDRAHGARDRRRGGDGD